ncbi:glutamine synthetase [Pseudoloma neurophilia]|uniref:Glutamine synthetase n=1 Tax=Pseudoloma neurophilia TaxID=146866 RepID=A0A0R0LW74_9MICR|nr:glutamine synthetase [Pseudoloma neurophilia]
MHCKREKTIQILLERKGSCLIENTADIPFKDNVFDTKKLLNAISVENKEKLTKILEEDGQIPSDIADEIAKIFKEWALSKKVFHFTHWFQPLHGEISEKSQNFIEITEKTKINVLCKDSLIKQETDGSSFPNGGLRSTFEARGYIIWDPKSPVFIFNNSLCIPSALVSFKEEALDYKAPFLKVNKFIETSALKIVQLFKPNAKAVKTYLGWEQEFFLFDKCAIKARKDLEITGRALIGRKGVKNQEFTNHYFGKIPLRVLNYMSEVERCAYGLGIPIKTRHNEVAPNQFEFSYFYDETQIAIDHNQLFMEIMKQIADKHELTVIFTEKPFQYTNGSGKHCNFSLKTDTGINLYQKSDNFEENLLFLCFLVATISGIHKYAPILNESISSYDNDQRLGGHEAPPSILSVFVGDDLHNFLIDKIQKSEKRFFRSSTHLPEIALDSHDRNRTSPFAFNGNRFEFRSVGASENCSEAMIALYTILGNEFLQMYEEIVIKKKDDKKLEDIALEVINKRIQESKSVLFTGDGYSEEWKKEANMRNLANFKNYPDCVDQINQKGMAKIFTENRIFTKNEIEARYGVKLLGYVNQAMVEKRILLDYVTQYILPSAEKYLYEITMFEEKISVESVKKRQKILSGLIAELYEQISMLHDEKHLRYMTVPKNIAEKILPVFQKIKKLCEEIEFYIPDEQWPILKNDELLQL